MKLIWVLGIVLNVYLLVSFSAANSYIIGKTNDINLDNKVGDYFDEFLKEGGSFLTGLLSINQIGIVSAEEMGCCIDNTEGLCTTNVEENVCTESGGEWDSEESCAIEECQRGCCVLGDNVQFVSEQRCEYLSGVEGFEKDYRQTDSEVECLALREDIGEGACVFEGSEENNCLFTSASVCETRGGIFNEGLLCSNPTLNTGCEKQASVQCVEGKDGIYWFDSCGNKENIYSSDKNASWNEGKVLGLGESCDPTTSNAGSKDCGNCNYLLGSICSNDASNGVEDSTLICADLRCKASEETGNVDRENGESWCVYDSYIGDGKDTAGSRHWKRSCVDGKVEVEPCADYRGEVCIQTDVDVGGDEISTAACVINRGRECVSYNNQEPETISEQCQSNSHCQYTEVAVDDGFTFNICTAKYPGGFDLLGKTDRGQESASLLCGMASQECTVVYQKTLTSGWECIANCDCETEKFSEEMNNLCIAMGDCGSYINYVGDGTENIVVENAPSISSGVYGEFAEPQEGQKVEPDSDDDLKRIGLGGESGEDLSSLSGKLAIAGGVGGSLGFAAMGVSQALANSGQVPPGVGTGLGISGKILGYFGKGSVDVVGGTTIGQVWKPAVPYFYADGSIVPEIPLQAIEGVPAQAAPTLLGQIGAGLSGAGVGLAVGGLVSKMFGLQGQGALATVISAGIAGAYGGVASLAGSTLPGAAIAGKIAGAVSGALGGAGAGGLGGALAGAAGVAAAAAVFALVIAIIVAAIMKLLGIGDTKEVIVKFECNPWQAPTGGGGSSIVGKVTDIGSGCEACNGDPLKPCSEYRCSSLGQACELINQNSENPECVEIKNPGGQTILKPVSISSNFSFSDESKNYVKIKPTEGECIPTFTPVVFSFEADRRAQCKYDYIRGKSYDEMSQYSLASTYYTMNHSFAVSMPSLEGLQSLGVEITGDIKQKYGDLKMYIKCEDIHGNVNTQDYTVDFCVESGPDKTAPKINAIVPESGSKVKYGETSANVVVYTNEPAECKYDLTEGVGYDAMSGVMECITGLNRAGPYGWECSSTLPLTAEGENNFYFKCRDKPWETVIENRNTNNQDVGYKISITNTPLEIVSTSPSTMMEAGFEPVAVDLEVETNGGVEGNGEAKCSFSFDSYENMMDFRNTYSNSHSQHLDSMIRGDKLIYVKCEDSVGNVALGNITFSIDIDSTPPRIVRAYNSGGLTVVTNEEAQCYYDYEKCNFNLVNGTEMNSGANNQHTAEWNEGMTYHIKCEDKWGNENSECAIKVSPGAI